MLIKDKSLVVLLNNLQDRKEKPEQAMKALCPTNDLYLELELLPNVDIGESSFYMRL